MGLGSYVSSCYCDSRATRSVLCCVCLMCARMERGVQALGKGGSPSALHPRCSRAGQRPDFSSHPQRKGSPDPSSISESHQNKELEEGGWRRTTKATSLASWQLLGEGGMKGRRREHPPFFPSHLQPHHPPPPPPPSRGEGRKGRADLQWINVVATFP